MLNLVLTIMCVSSYLITFKTIFHLLHEQRLECINCTAVVEKEVRWMLGAVYIGMTFLERNLAMWIKILKDVMSGNCNNFS